MRRGSSLHICTSARAWRRSVPPSVSSGLISAHSALQKILVLRPSPPTCYALFLSFPPRRRLPLLQLAADRPPRGIHLFSEWRRRRRPRSVLRSAQIIRREGGRFARLSKYTYYSNSIYDNTHTLTALRNIVKTPSHSFLLFFF